MKMQAIPVQATRPIDQPKGVPTPPVSSVELDLQRVRQLANVLDTKFSIAGIRFGFDAIIGLIPGVGDVATLLAGLYPLYVAQKHGIGLPTRARMLSNLLLDAGLGAVPLLGDLFDIGFRANTKNLRLL